MGFLAAIFIPVLLVLLAYSYWHDMAALAPETHFTKQRFAAWLLQGMVTPVLFWLLLNSGLIPGAPLFVDTLIQAKKADLPAAIVEALGIAAFITASWWTSITFAWLIGSALPRIPDGNRPQLKERLFWCGILLTPIAIGLSFLTGWPGIGFAALLLLLPLTHTLLPLLHWEPPPVSYSHALGRMRFGDYDEAELAVIRELEQREDDFEGWMLLAELYAVHFRDLPAADDTIRAVCDNENTTISQCGVALHRLADWHLTIGHDPRSARAALEGICLKYPGTPLDRMARQRINQMPATAGDLERSHAPRVIPLPSISPSPTQPPEGSATVLTPEEARTQAESCAGQLRQDPADVSVRERYAHLLREHLGQQEEALRQLQWLLELKDQPDDKRARWLSQAAEIELRHHQNFDRAIELLRELIHQYPQTPEAFQGQRRLSLLSIEMRLKNRG